MWPVAQRRKTIIQTGTTAYSTVQIRLSTHDAAGVTNRDFHLVSRTINTSHAQHRFNPDTHLSKLMRSLRCNYLSTTPASCATSKFFRHCSCIKSRQSACRGNWSCAWRYRRLPAARDDEPFQLSGHICLASFVWCHGGRRAELTRHRKPGIDYAGLCDLIEQGWPHCNKKPTMQYRRYRARTCTFASARWRSRSPPITLATFSNRICIFMRPPPTPSAQLGTPLGKLTFWATCKSGTETNRIGAHTRSRPGL